MFAYFVQVHTRVSGFPRDAHNPSALRKPCGNPEDLFGRTKYSAGTIRNVGM
jgi:hypothetical protein